MLLMDNGLGIGMYEIHPYLAIKEITGKIKATTAACKPAD